MNNKRSIHITVRPAQAQQRRAQYLRDHRNDRDHNGDRSNDRSGR